MADFEKASQDKLNEESTFYDPEEGVEYEYVEEEEVSEDGVEYEYVEEEEVSEDGVEYEYVEEEEVPEDGVEYEYVEEEEVPEDGVEYEYAEGEELPDGMASFDGEEAGGSGASDGDGMNEIQADGEFAADGSGIEDTEALDAGSEDGEEEDGAEKPKSFFGRLAEATPYEVMVWLAFIFVIVGILLMIMEWMRYDMIVYPDYTK